MNLLCSYLFVMLGDRYEMSGIELLKLTLYVLSGFVKILLFLSVTAGHG